MRTLKFNVEGQSITPAPNCDFSGIVPGTEGYLEASFAFSEEWRGCGMIAVFTKLGEEYLVKLENGSCTIPEEALTYKRFGVEVIGVRPGYRIKTGKAVVEQNG